VGFLQHLTALLCLPVNCRGCSALCHRPPGCQTAVHRYSELHNLSCQDFWKPKSFTPCWCMGCLSACGCSVKRPSQAGNRPCPLRRPPEGQPAPYNGRYHSGAGPLPCGTFPRLQAWPWECRPRAWSAGEGPGLLGACSEV